jgi:hypothetical protein
MEKKRIFTPSFINKLDKQLLKNNPVTWSTRIHLVLYYAILFSALILLISFIAPADPRNESVIYYWIILLSIISLLAFICWMIFLLRFNVFKRFGKWNNLDTLKTFLLYFFITLLIVSWPFIPPIVESIRANAAYTSDELVKDVNDMNIKICQLERDSIETRFSRDTFQVKDVIKGSEMRTVYNNDYPVTDNDPGSYYYTDTVNLRSKLEVADSVKQVNDSVWVIYDCPDYKFIYEYSLENKSNQQLLSSMDLYRLVLQDKQTVNTESIKKELGRLFVKYSKLHDAESLSAGLEESYYDEVRTYMSKIRDKYDLYFVNRRVESITEKKYRWSPGVIEVSWRVTYYITLALALLVLIFRHTTRRTFFLSLLTAVVLSILTGLFIAMSPYSEGSFYTWMIIYYIIFCVLSALVITARNRNVVSGIALNLAVLITPLMPLIITAAYYSALHKKYDYIGRWESYNHFFKNEEYHYFLSEIGGFVLLFLLLATLFQKAYRKWFSQPEL